MPLPGIMTIPVIINIIRAHKQLQSATFPAAAAIADFIANSNANSHDSLLKALKDFVPKVDMSS
jgi:hypothetical protein